jgi:WhiB family transcriptional regulator, redox-sensing transcriptional regulator
MTDWRDQALCRDEDPELFFPIGVAGSSLEQIDSAKAVCRQCPVSRQCLALALDSGQDVGIWGGLTAEERRTLRRRSLSARTR